jgi:hypothetical protein
VFFFLYFFHFSFLSLRLSMLVFLIAVYMLYLNDA